MSRRKKAAPSQEMGGILTLQMWRDGKLVRFEAYARGLNASGDRGSYRANPDEPWQYAAIDAVVARPEGPIYCVHAVGAPEGAVAAPKTSGRPKRRRKDTAR